MADTLKLVSGGDDIKIWEPQNLRLIQTLKPHSQAISSLSWSPNNNFLASTAPGEKVVVTSFKGTSPNSIELQGCEDDSCVAFNSISRHLLTAGKSKVLNLWDLKTRSIRKKIKSPKEDINCVTFNWNDTNIASGTISGDIFLHNVSTTQTSSPLRLQKTQTIHALHYSKFKKALLGSVSDDGAMNIWDTNSKKVVASFSEQHVAPAMDICFSPMNDMLLASVGLDKKIIFYDVHGKKVIKEMSAESPLTSVSFKQDGAAFAVGSTRGKIFIYDLRSGSSTPLHSIAAHKSAVHCVSFQLPQKGHSSSSSTLAEKFTSRSSADPSKSQASPFPERPPGHEVLEPLQNGLKSNHEDGTIFSPLRDGLGTYSSDLGKESNQHDKYEPAGSSRRPEGVTGIFSPISNSTSSYQPPTLKSRDTFPTNRSATHSINGHPDDPLAKDDVKYVTRQPALLTTSTPRVGGPSLSSSSNQVPGTLVHEKHKPGSTLESITDQDFVVNANEKKTIASSTQMQVERQRALKRKPRQTENLSSSAVSDETSLTGSTEVVNGYVQPSSTNHAENASGFQEFQIQFMKNLIDDSLDEFRVNFHQDIVNLQVEMLRQFQIQQNEMKGLLRQYSLNDALVEENERLREEIRRLKSTH